LASKRKSKQQLTRLELQIMQALWETGPATVQDVQKKLSDESLAYTTVQTMLNVLQRKARVTRTGGLPTGSRRQRDHSDGD
jgi:BlaI family penicillinase repressor